MRGRGVGSKQCRRGKHCLLLILACYKYNIVDDLKEGIGYEGLEEQSSQLNFLKID